MIYDDLVSETLTDPLPDGEPAADPVVELPPTVHDAMDCPTCQAWLAHVREAEADDV